MTYIIIAVLLLAAELIYYRIADKCNIIDKPNERSSHSTIALRGGGIIFPISIFVWMILQMVKGRLDEVLYEEVVSADGKITLKETERIHLCPEEGVYGCQVPKGVWHTVEVLEPSVIYEGKDKKYGEDGSETYPSM